MLVLALERSGAAIFAARCGVYFGKKTEYDARRAQGFRWP